MSPVASDPNAISTVAEPPPIVTVPVEVPVLIFVLLFEFAFSEMAFPAAEKVPDVCEYPVIPERAPLFMISPLIVFTEVAPVIAPERPRVPILLIFPTVPATRYAKHWSSEFSG
jgi:hypothetical protein